MFQKPRLKSINVVKRNDPNAENESKACNSLIKKLSTERFQQKSDLPAEELFWTSLCCIPAPASNLEHRMISWSLKHLFGKNPRKIQCAEHYDLVESVRIRLLEYLHRIVFEDQ